MSVFVYMLQCADGSYYIGSATGDDLARRVDQHNQGAFPGYTFSRRLVELVWSEHFVRATDAIATERRIGAEQRKKRSCDRTGAKSARWPVAVLGEEGLNDTPSFEARQTAEHLRMTFNEVL